MIARLIGPIRPYLWAGAAVLSLILLAWGLRVDSLRATYKQRWQDVTGEYAAFRTKIIDRTAAALRREREDAHEADQKHDAGLPLVRAATDRYIAAHRVQAPRNDSGTAAATAGAGVSEEVPADTFVAVRDGDVQACADAVKYAVDAHDWAVNSSRESSDP